MTVEDTEPPRICEGGKGNFLPLFEAEKDWDFMVKIFLYLFGLLWCFQGVEVLAAGFSGAIEKITSRKKQVICKKTGKKITVMVWNSTVACLTLMALGSSAPEILLNVIEVLGRGFFAGDLGPSTIVGSAAFNQLVITAVCIVAIPDKEIRAIRDTSSFFVTACFSVFAYMWLLVILMFVSEDVVEWWEALLTFIMFPVLVVVAYMVDVGYLGTRPLKRMRLVLSELSPEQLDAEIEAIRAERGPLSDSQVIVCLKHKFEGAQPKSKAAYREEARSKRRNTVNLALDQELLRKMQAARRTSARMAQMAQMPSASNTESGRPRCTIGMKSSKVVSTGTGEDVIVDLVRTGWLDCIVQVVYATRETSGTEPINTTSELEFLPGEASKTIRVSTVGESGRMASECSVEILSLTSDDAVLCVMGDIRSTDVLLLSDSPGVLAFADDNIAIQEGKESVTAKLVVRRSHGTAGEVSCSYVTEDDSALDGFDYRGVSGTLEFAHGQMEATIEVEILPASAFEGIEKFRVILTDTQGGAIFDPGTDGGEESCVCTVWIEAQTAGKGALSRMMTAMNWDAMRSGKGHWKQQLIEAWYCNGSPEEQMEATHFDWMMHIVYLPWKLVFALCPPTDYGNGWVCFWVALGLIGLVTAVIGDLAGLLGCCLGVPDEITAITFVALGTSLPDTFASKTAAEQDPYADASLSNVTGSNSVNVFLGLGLPWLMCAVYWEAGGATPKWNDMFPDISARYPGGKFVVYAGGLSFSVIVFTSCSILCFATLFLRRILWGGELGGPKVWQWITGGFMVFLWIVYIAASCYSFFSGSAGR